MTPPRTRTPGHSKRCACESCSAHRRRYDALRILDNAVHGPRRLPVEPYREIIRAHLDAGWSAHHLAHLYQCTSRAVLDIAQGRTTIVRRFLARRIERAVPSYANAPDGVLVPAQGTRRRLQALWCLGWTVGHVQQHVTVRVRGLSLTGQVHVDTHRQVAAAYDLMAASWGPSRITRARARRLGYVPPAGWDDIDTDPEPPTPDEHVSVVDEAEWLARTGETLEGAAHRLGYASADSLDMVLRRAGRQDLLDRLRGRAA